MEIQWNIHQNPIRRNHSGTVIKEPNRSLNNGKTTWKKSSELDWDLAELQITDYKHEVISTKKPKIDENDNIKLIEISENN